ncbi:rCG56245 [Rattus norvegicus]|uniref:RCG56245 n=1 Tax=Rattus norvegicus TaxID=10116 RepID=A6IAU8_RAT|nr:rCG56245 [Rattus norvegicus]
MTAALWSASGLSYVKLHEAALLPSSYSTSALQIVQSCNHVVLMTIILTEHCDR